jgi:hypothetical protein
MQLRLAIATPAPPITVHFGESLSAPEAVLEEIHEFFETCGGQESRRKSSRDDISDGMYR